jgi:signal recognition particle subunit SRP54
MLDNLTQRLARVMKTLRGEARLTEANIGDALREVRLALLEADVALPAVKELIAAVREKAVGEEVIGSLSPGQALIGVVHRELTRLMGEAHSGLNLATQPPAIVLMAGLQGSGKTTTVGKLAKLLRETQKKKVLVVSCDVYRPAAIEQLKTVADRREPISFRRRQTEKPVDIARAAVDWAKTALPRRAAGRHRRPPGHRRGDDEGDRRAACGAQADRDALRRRCDAGPGRDQHRQGLQRGAAADRRHPHQARWRRARRCGAVGSSRHRAADQVRRRRREADRLEAFHPERMASRILGMGDVLSLIEEAKKGIDEEKAIEFAKKLKSGKTFDLNDFKDQIGQMRKMGGLSSMMEKLPAQFSQAAGQLPAGGEEKAVARIEGIINSMTPPSAASPSCSRPRASAGSRSVPACRCRRSTACSSSSSRRRR